MRDQKVRSVMTADPLTLPASASLTDAARAMREHSIGSVIVMDGDAPCGIVTDRDIVVRALAVGADPNRTVLQDICSRGLAKLAPDDSVDNAIALMTKKAIRRIPVLDDGRVAGVVSLGDLAQIRDRRSALGGISAAAPNL